jgi:hypothetical protein
MTFSDRGIIAKLDKRLDASAWPPDGAVTTSALQFKSMEGGLVLLEVTKEDDGWPWVDMRFDPSRGATAGGAHGRLVICGFGLIEKWNAGPAPRFLVARLLEYLESNEARETDTTTDDADT